MIRRALTHAQFTVPRSWSPAPLQSTVVSDVAVGAALFGRGRILTAVLRGGDVGCLGIVLVKTPGHGPRGWGLTPRWL